ncbi:MAG TPA: glycoside hydrolase family 2 TIM barrel-domain containing protein, partial [Candidatus Limnocylindrales bacterium]|nr:glycoside hydrolase family 2 TIM barrel-domain containing protein [Candidatus Limnocylindrales bacterium]
ADVTVVVQNRGPAADEGSIEFTVRQARLDAADLLDPDPADLVAGTRPVAEGRATVGTLGPGAIAAVRSTLSIPNPRSWDIGRPGLYVLEVTVRDAAGRSDTLDATFGLRQVAVDPTGPRILLNGRAVTFGGVALHDESITPGPDGEAATGTPAATAAQALRQLRQVQAVGATLLRMGHVPAEPALLTLADRLGLAVWEEVPLTHFTPLSFGLTLARGIPQQMAREMALRDMNHPSVLFYGLANESSGGPAQAQAMGELRTAIRALDPTRLLGQAGYSFDVDDRSSDDLDVVGFTFYHGVFYGGDATTGTRDALAAAHARYPAKPIVVLEFGHWADGPEGTADQVRILDETGRELALHSTARPGGYVAAMVWWTLDDYFTSQPGIDLERFGLFEPDGTPRPVASAAASLYASLAVTLPTTTAPADAPVAAPLAPPPSGASADVSADAPDGRGHLGWLATLMVYGFGVGALTLGAWTGLALRSSRLPRRRRR